MSVPDDIIVFSLLLWGVGAFCNRSYVLQPPGLFDITLRNFAKIMVLGFRQVDGDKVRSDHDDSEANIMFDIYKSNEIEEEVVWKIKVAVSATLHFMKVNLIRKASVEDFMTQNARSRSSMNLFLELLKAAYWENPNDIKSTFGKE
ncbi:MAG: hypothetical protein IPP15_06510 [Saprospiraceae bacterium]|uniref:Uncharacterized protein n=1 Tax=Candidatus Opimibacter skivensis TaxID=2982028 RepID=A0A9D7SWA6_9BACT|nr:hypothetical protein [Candidatus Opimibacter skivensis]